LVYSKATSQPARWVLAVPAESKITTPEDLEGGIVATELLNCTRKYFEKKKTKVKVEFSWGTTEVKARLVDAIVDITETGSSLTANNLRVVDTILTSTTRLIANKQAMKDPWKKAKIESITLLLQGALEGREKVGLKMNIPRSSLDTILALLPAEKSPTISSLANDAFVAVEVILTEKAERELIPQLKKSGASGIITYPLNKVIP
jgi:ATP phosphoribosyltransferase